MFNFDENGHALESGLVTVYNFRDFTHEYLGTSEEYIPIGFGIPGHSTLISPPPAKDGHARCFDGTTWSYVEDHRGKPAYSITDRSEYMVSELGPLKSGFTFLKPDNQFSVWNGASWEDDVEAMEAEQIRLNRGKQLALTADAGRRIDVLADAVDLDMATPEEVDLLKRLRQYRVHLSRVDLANPVWPDIPV